MKGVELYVSDFQRPLTERIAKDFFSDPAQSAVTCVRTGPVTLDPSINKSPEGEEARVHPRPPALSLRACLCLCRSALCLHYATSTAATVCLHIIRNLETMHD